MNCTQGEMCVIGGLMPRASEGAMSVSSRFREIGYDVVEQTVADSHFSAVDETFASFVAEIAERKEVQHALDDLQAKWMTNKKRCSYYDGAPMGFRDRTGRSDKEAKRYFQYCQEFGQLARLECPDLFRVSKTIATLICLLDSCAASAETAMLTYIRMLAEEYPGIDAVLTRKDRPAPVLLRLIQYASSPVLSVVPHVDKSALTLHMHSNDGPSERFIMGKPDEFPRLSTMKAVERASEAGERALVFAGALLREAGFDVPPTPHAVFGGTSSVPRQALVAFWLVPNLNTDHLTTDVPFVEDLPTPGLAA
jgi:hypothetical protein